MEKSVSDKGRLGLSTTLFFKDLVGFPSHKKSKAIYEGMKTRECQGVYGILGSVKTC